MTPAIDRGTERALVGALIVEPRHLALVAELTLADFGDPQARLAYKALRNVEAVGEAITPATVRAEIERDAGHCDLRWLDVLLHPDPEKRTADPGKPDAIVAGWAQAVARQAEARREAEEAEALAELDAFADRDRDDVPPFTDALPLERRAPQPTALDEPHDVLVRKLTDLADDLRRGAINTDDPLHYAITSLQRLRNARQSPRWHRCRDLVGAIVKQAAEPSVSLALGGDEIITVRPGGIILEIGASGGGKTSLAASLLVEHAHHIGPAIAMSLELPGEEFTGRVVGIRCDASWLDVLTGKIPEEHMRRALPERLALISRRDASFDALVEAIEAMRGEYPGEPILVALDYVQLVPSDEREIRRRVAHAMERLDSVARDHRVVAIAVSQGSRASSRALSSGEKIGAETTDAGAEAAELERWSTATLAIGPHAPSEDGDSFVQLNVGKSRMGGGDRVIPMRYCGRSGRWRVAGVSRSASEVKAERDTKKIGKRVDVLTLAIPGLLNKSATPMSRAEIRAEIGGRDLDVRAACSALLEAATGAPGDVVEVGKRSCGAFKLWTRERAEAAGVAIVPRLRLVDGGQEDAP